MGVADEDFAGPAVVEVDGELAAHSALDALYPAVSMTWMAHAVADMVAVDALEGVDGRTLREHLLCRGGARAGARGAGGRSLRGGRAVVGGLEAGGVAAHASPDGGCLLVEGIVRPW